jgi:phospholipid/cholesterol/gamma-HCH transport system ATP-binding protein
MRRFSFGGRSKKDQPDAAGADQQSAWQPPAQQPEASQPSSEAPTQQHDAGASWLPEGREGWETPGAGRGDAASGVSDEPAPMQPQAHAGDAHDGQGAEPGDGQYGQHSDPEQPAHGLQQAARDPQSGGSGDSPWTDGEQHEDGERDEWESPVAQGHVSEARPADEAQETARAQAQGESDRGGSRVSVVDEEPDRPGPPPGADAEEFQYHTYKVYPSGAPDAVEFIDCYKSFGKAHILRGLNMGLPEGMVSMILGPSGTGKSVCINHMVGLLYPDEGDVLVHGESVPNMADDDLFEMRKKFGLLFQDGALFGSMNLYDNVAFPLRQHTEKGEDEVEDVVMRRLDEVGLGSAREKMPNELSGGMRKRAGFARALVLEPQIVMFDEPDSGLDPVRTALLCELIREVHAENGGCYLTISHDLNTARRIADFLAVLWNGKIVESGPKEELFDSENAFVAQFLAADVTGPLSMD